MNKPLLSLVGLCLTCAASAFAEEGQYLHIHTVDGWKVLDMEKVDRLTFSGASMIASDVNNNPVETFDRNDLTEMFVSETSGIESVASDAANAAFTFKQGVATMLADGVFEVYDIDGTLLVSIKAQKGDNIDLTEISSNVVILKSGNFSTKVSMR